MPTGRLAAVQSGLGTNTTVYTVPVGKTASFSINVLNSSGSISTVSIALSANATPTIAEFIEDGLVLEPSQVVERTGLVLDAGKIVVVKTGDQMSVVVYGYEE